jgi:hypothetical protein
MVDNKYKNRDTNQILKRQTFFWNFARRKKNVNRKTLDALTLRNEKHYIVSFLLPLLTVACWVMPSNATDPSTIRNRNSCKFYSGPTYERCKVLHITYTKMRPHYIIPFSQIRKTKCYPTGFQLPATLFVCHVYQVDAIETLEWKYI